MTEKQITNYLEKEYGECRHDAYAMSEARNQTKKDMDYDYEWDDGSTAVGAIFADSVSAGTTIEGRWKHVKTGSGECVICYLKAVPAQTF